MQEVEEKRCQKEEKKATKQTAIQHQNNIRQTDKEKKKTTKPTTAIKREDINKKTDKEEEEAPMAVNS